MSYEGLFIAKGGVTLDIPLYDSSTTLMTLHLLYDCHIQLLTLDLHLTWLNITMHMYSCEKIMAWASLARHQWHLVCYGETNSLTCLWWWSWWVDSRLSRPWWCACTSWWHLAEVNSCLRCNRCICLTPSSNSSANMCMVFLGVAELETHWYMVSMVIFKRVLVVMCINLPKYMFSSSWTCFLYSPWWVCWMGRITFVHSTTCMLPNPLHVIKNTSHHVYSMSPTRMNLLLVQA